MGMAASEVCIEEQRSHLVLPKKMVRFYYLSASLHITEICLVVFKLMNKIKFIKMLLIFKVF